MKIAKKLVRALAVASGLAASSFGAQATCADPAANFVDWAGCTKWAADLTGANLFGANLFNANLGYANLTGASLNTTNMT